MTESTTDRVFAGERPVGELAEQPEEHQAEQPASRLVAPAVERQAEPSAQHQAEQFAERPSSDLVALVAIGGFALFWAAVLAMLLKTATAEGASAAGALFVGFALVQLLSLKQMTASTKKSGQKARRRFFQPLAAGAFALPALALLFWHLANSQTTDVPLVLPLIAWFCFGTAAGVLLPNWGAILTTLDSERASAHPGSLNIAWSVALAALVAAALIFVPPVLAKVTAVLLLIASAAVLLFCERALPEVEHAANGREAAERGPAPTAAEDVERASNPLAVLDNGSVLAAQPLRALCPPEKPFTLLSRNLAGPLLMGALWSSLSVPPLLTSFELPVLGFVLAAVLVAALGMAGLLLALKRMPHHSTIERFVTSVVAASLALLLIDASYIELGLTLRLALVFIALAALTFYLISHWMVLVALSYRHQVRPLRHYGQGLIAPSAGAALGWLIAVAVFTGLQNAPQATLLLAVASLAALVLVASLAPPTANEVVETVFEFGEDDSDDKGKDGSSDTQGRWQHRLLALSDEGKLSPREVEVFSLLAKGRNAEHISKTLFISTHTAKTHIYRIYRKLDVNTQQELIDRFDADRR